MKRALLISGLMATAVTAFGAAGITSGELDLPGLNQRIDNIDARTTNNEQDIQALQQSTGTAPAAHVDVPAPPTQTTTTVAATPAPQPVGQPTATPAPTATPTPTPCVAPVVSNAPGTRLEVIGGGCQ